MIAVLKNEEKRPWNHKRISRVYRELELNLTRRARKRLPKRAGQPLTVPQAVNQCWSMDFMRDCLANGHVIRTLNIIDDYNREALTIEVGVSLPAKRVIAVLETLIAWRGAPLHIRTDNGPEFISRALESWARMHQIEVIHIQPGKPAQNGYIERFNRTYREEVLDANLFDTLTEAREITAQWIKEYNTKRPHDALSGLTPCQYAVQYASPVSLLTGMYLG